MKTLLEKLRSPDIDDLPPIPLNEVADDLGAIADELRCAWELDGFAAEIDAIAERIEDREVLNQRKKHLDETWPVGSDGKYQPRNADQLIKHIRRDRRYQEDMKLILAAGGTTYRGKQILGGKGDPYIQRFSREEVVAEFRGDWRNQLGRKQAIVMMQGMTKIEAAGKSGTASANLQKGEVMLETNTPGKPQPQLEPSQQKLTQGENNMESTTVTPAPASSDSKPVSGHKSRQKNTNAHINLVAREVAVKMTRKLTEDEISSLWRYATAADHSVTTDEAAAFLQASEHEEEKKEQNTADMIATWNKRATELHTDLTAKIGTFAAMKGAVEQVQEDFKTLKAAINKKSIPESTRILPDFAWTKVETKDGKEIKTEQKGFVDFQDYCREVLKRTKQAVYKMLSDYTPPEKQEVDNSIEAITQRSGKALYNMFLKAQEVKTDLRFDAFVTSITAVAKEKATADARKASKQDQKKANRLLAAKAVAGIQ